ncbi:MAG: arsenate reductase family protein [Longimicrobiales bacterium]|nr:arsenate reductase family protein [Longimicrobiales bacterium]
MTRCRRSSPSSRGRTSAWSSSSATTGERRPELTAREAAMEVQIFGTQGCADTRKALRFFKERRVKVHFVDLRRKAASKGELRRFVQKFGTDALIDREGGRFRALGLTTAHYGDARWLEILEEEPLILRTPLVRWQQRLTLGHDEETWREWTR